MNNSMLCIGVNILALYPGKIGGAEQYVRNFVAMLSTHSDVEAYVFVNNEAAPTFSESDCVHVIQIGNGENIDRELNYWIDYKSLQVMFCPLFFVAPHDCTIPVVPSILDVQHEFFPQYFEPQVLEEIRSRTKETLKAAAGILTISEFSKKTIHDKYGVPEENIEVTYLDADKSFSFPPNETRERELETTIGSGYIFYPANSWPHKNHINLLKAYKILKDRYAIKNKLLFTGDSKQQRKTIEEFIKQNNLTEDVIYLGYVRQEDMPYVYANAKMLVFPSLFEGFGIPLVEAMRVGIPIACSNCGSIPEIAQNAAVYFEPECPEDIASKLYLLINETDLVDRLIKNGSAIAKQYSWKNCTDKTLLYLKKIVSDQSHKYSYDDCPLVSVITPSFNQGQFIRETIESVLSQDYKNIEYIVMDGGSTDDTISILKSYGNRIRWISQEDDGQADAVNKGIKIAKGQIIGWLNSDDTYMPGTIRKVVSYFKDHLNTDLVYGEGYYTDISGKVVDRYLTEKFDTVRLSQQCIICQPTAFFTKKIIEAVGGLDARFQLSMDYELWMRIDKIGKISYMPEYLATSRMYADNKTSSRRKEVYKETCYAVQMHYGCVSSSWLYGYADYLAKGKRSAEFKMQFLRLSIKYNWRNKSFWKQMASSMLKRDKFSHVLKHRESFDGQYADGWVSENYIKDLRFSGSEKKIVIRGDLENPIKPRLTLSVYVDNRKMGTIKLINNGEFVQSIAIHESARKAGIHKLRICSNVSFVPAKIAISEDHRVLSFILREVRVE